MTLLKSIPNVWLAALSLALPLGVFWFFQEDSLPFLIGLAGAVTAYGVYVFGYVKHVFAALMFLFLFSIELPILGGAALSLPAEPLAILLFLVGLLALVDDGASFFWFKSEPIIWAIGLLLAVWIISLLTSSMQLVSAKYVFINLVFLVVGIVVFPRILMEQQFIFSKGMKLLFIPLIFFGLYAIYRLYPYGFNAGAAPEIAYPFFKDHTVFSATISLFTPALLLWRTFQSSPQIKDWIPFAIGLLLLIALFISSSRAAWLALILAAVFYGFIKLKGTLKTLVLIVVALGAMGWFFSSVLENKLLVNPYKSTDVSGSLQDQALSVTNVSSDVSNRERLNRWSCAIRMGLDKPLTGFGPGTYQFQYLPYQRDGEMTYISVTDPFTTIRGKGGSAHSEYLLLLAESGFFGLAAWFLLQLALLLTFFKIWKSNLSTKDKNLAFAVFLGVLTYSTHSLFNNYLNTAQLGISWWMMVGTLLYLAKKNKQIEESA